MDIGEKMELPDVDKAISEAPLPTKMTLKARTNVVFQVVRFGIFALRMLKMVLKGHEE